MRTAVRAWPFASKYLRDFAVVEERRDGRRLFPATEQLPVLSAAITREFEAGLRTRLANTDARADDLRKIELRAAAVGFCQFANAARPDHLHVQPFYTPDRVTQLSVVQQISETGPQGGAHWFRQFRGAAFLPDIYLAGKRLVFASHVFDRFAERIALIEGHPVVELWSDFIGSVVTILLTSGRPAFVTLTFQGVLALPFRETADEFFVLTALGANEINRLELPVPPRPTYFHYGPTPPVLDEADTAELGRWLIARWRDTRGQSCPVPKLTRTVPWIRYCQNHQKQMAEYGFIEGSVLAFHDNVYGPALISHPAGPCRAAAAPPPAPEPA